MLNLIIAISKGRIFDKTIIFLKSKNIIIKENIKTRKLYLKTNKKNLFIVLIKNIDIKNYIKLKIFDFIIFGKDLIIENNFKINYINLKFLKFNISIISNKKFHHINFFKKNLTIYTKYINITKQYINEKNIKNILIKKIEGCIELLLKLKICNIIIDITESGKTCFYNKLFIIKNLFILNPVINLNNNLIYKKFFKIIKSKSWEYMNFLEKPKKLT